MSNFLNRIFKLGSNNDVANNDATNNDVAELDNGHKPIKRSEIDNPKFNYENKTFMPVGVPLEYRKPLPLPISQRTEVLMLLLSSAYVTRAGAFEHANILNLPSHINSLRKKGFLIVTHTIKTKNKFGRPVNYAAYQLIDRTRGVNLYRNLWQKKQR